MVEGHQVYAIIKLKRYLLSRPLYRSGAMDLFNQNFWSLSNENEVLQALETLSVENVESVYQRVDQDGNSLLFCAVQKGFNTVAQNILESSTNYSVNAQQDSTPLHFAPNSSGLFSPHFIY